MQNERKHKFRKMLKYEVIGKDLYPVVVGLSPTLIITYQHHYLYIHLHSIWGVVRQCDGAGNFQYQGVLLPGNLITVGQGPIALAIGAGGGCSDNFTLIYHFCLLSPSLRDGPI